MSAKYIEIKYPVVEDVCQLMKCPFTFDEFVQMAEMSQKRFEGLRGADAVIVNTNEIIATNSNDKAGVMNKFLN